MRLLLLSAFSYLVTLLLAASPLHAQTYQSPNQGPFRTISAGEDALLMLEGHDAVAYFTQNAAVKGDPAIKLAYRGVVYRFASEANRAAFMQEPERYMPQFGGFCSNGINYAVPWGGGGGPDSCASLLERGSRRVDRLVHAREAPCVPRAALPQRRRVAGAIRGQAGGRNPAGDAGRHAGRAAAIDRAGFGPQSTDGQPAVNPQSTRSQPAVNPRSARGQPMCNWRRRAASASVAR